ncbi:MAG: CBS domain-containing protein [Parabacteroides sp.]|nr:CBS domain-containing protein [Parabacteroides sp.]
MLKSFDTGDYPTVQENASVYEALALFARYRCNRLSVVNEEGEYVGYLTAEKWIELMAELCQAETTGSVLVLEMLPQDYSMTDIARLVESNQAHILSMLSYPDKQTGRLHLMIKIDLEDASPVVRSFERFNYQVLYAFMEKSMIDDVLQHRMKELVHYMNI